jgi:uncharacterized cofD-like protein
VVAIGGGHGLAATLAAVRTYAGDVTAVVSVADDGGSSGRLRQSLSIPAPGDVRRCLVALADADSLWARVFDYRFGAGDLEGHALGNLIIAGLSETTGDFTRALGEAARLLGVAGRVLPATTSPTVLRASVDGAEVVGEVEVNTSAGSIASVSVVGPDGVETRASDSVVDAVAGADQVVIGPGSLFTSVLAACVVPGVCEALAARSGGRVYVANLAPEHRETEGMSLTQHLAALNDHGVTVDVVVCDPKAFEAAGGMGPVDDGAGPVIVGATEVPVRVVTADLAGPGGRAHQPGHLAVVLRDLLPG